MSSGRGFGPKRGRGGRGRGRGNISPGPLICFRCGREGHVAARCNTNLNTNSMMPLRSGTTPTNSSYRHDNFNSDGGANRLRPQHDGRQHRGGAAGPPCGRRHRERTPSPPPVPLPILNPIDSRQKFASKKDVFVQAKSKALTEHKDLRIHTLRPEFADTGRNVFVCTNHFAATLPKEDLYQYTVVGVIEENETNKQNAEDDEYSEIDEPKEPSRAKKAALVNQVFQECQVLGEQRQYFATDYLSVIISWKDLSIWNGNGPAKPGDPLANITIEDKPAVGRREATLKDVKVVYDGRVPVQSFVKACAGDIQSLPLEPSDMSTYTPGHAMNIIVSEATKASSNAVFQIGAKKFFAKSSKAPLEDGLVGYQGFFSTIKLGMGQPLLNVSTATSAFYAPIPVEQFMRTYRNRHGQTYSDDALDALKEVKVKISYQSGRQATIKGFGRPPQDLKFRDRDGNLISVLDHMRTKPNLPQGLLELVENSQLPCANVGSLVKKQWFPVEALHIIEYQPYKLKLGGDMAEAMIRLARDHPANNRRKLVEDGLRLLAVSAQDGQNSILADSGIHIDPAMLKIPAREIPTPRVRYRSSRMDQRTKTFPESNAVIRNARWDLRDKNFFDTSHTFNGRILVLLPGNLQGHPHVPSYGASIVSGLITEMGKLGIEFPNGTDVHDVRSIDTRSNIEDKFMHEFKEAKKVQTKLVVFINNDKTAQYADAFAAFKRIADQKMGIHSLCLVHATLQKQKRSWQQYMANVAMKVNLKLGNINHTFLPPSDEDGAKLNKVFYNPKLLLDTIILGADVTHAPPGSAETTPSLAAVVGSVDGLFGKFLGSMRYQATNTEIIEKLEDMVYERLKAWTVRNKRLPNKILYYRDGVSDGQYSQVRESEIRKIRAAYSTLQKEMEVPQSEPLITAVVVTKRHHTRFYPLTEQPKVNCTPGTVIDSGVTHPCYFDFFLQSHAPMAGTAKPTYYFVLENGMGFGANELQNFTNWLCYTYVRATLPVGYAPPAYYADRLCERARCYLKGFYKQNEIESDSSDDGTAKERKKKLKARKREEAEVIKKAWLKKWEDNDGNAEGPWHSNLNDTMFWM